MGAEPCLHMAYGNLMVVGCQRTGKGSGSITMHQHDIRLLLLQYLVQPHHGPGGNIKQGLPGCHNIQIMVRLNLKQIQNLVQHIPMLGSNSYHRHNLVRMLRQLQHNRCHLDCFRTGAEHSHDLNLLSHHKSLSTLNYFVFNLKIPSFFAPINTTSSTHTTITMDMLPETSFKTTALSPNSALITYIRSTACFWEKPKSKRR